MARISAENLSISYGQKVILDSLSLKVADGQITTIIGANGCGKSTMLRALTRILAPISGQVLLDGQSIAKMPTKEVAKQMALLPQVLDASESITVYELVSYGRFPHQSGLGRLTEEDREKIDWAMTATNILDYANLPVDGLSGGQRQRVWIAMALAQDTEIIFLDEPTTYLDMNHQLEVLELLQRLNREMNKTIVMVLHDLNLASRFSDQLIAMRAGQIKYQGTVDDIMTADVLRDIFQVQVQLARDPIHDRPILLTYQLLTK